MPIKPTEKEEAYVIRREFKKAKENANRQQKLLEAKIGSD